MGGWRWGGKVSCHMRKENKLWRRWSMADMAGSRGCQAGELPEGWGRGKLCSDHSSSAAPRLCPKSGPPRRGGETRPCGAALSGLWQQDPPLCLALALVCSASLCSRRQEVIGATCAAEGGVRALRPRHLVRRFLHHASTNTAALSGPCLHALRACSAAAPGSQQRPAAWSLVGRSVSRESEERCAQ